ncbi:hypothetical protein C4D60_Mb07t18330 [Musa balbisiana]|uniref:BHLH domain-containing protein n=1 Tax=Musa balbisiana TaxID=52838 RepID=A0A4S8JG80_MUSBA|nr:hypothetical protein C4D60_Mb07t18330 [Musa balbisiana]
MNRGLFQNSLVQQHMVGGSSNCWSLNSMRPPPEQTFPLLPSSSSSSSPSVSPQAEEEKYGLTPPQIGKMKNWEDRLVYPSTAPAHMSDIKQEISGNGYLHSGGNEEIQASKSPWSRIIPSSSPESCIAASFGRSMLDFSNKSERMHHQPDNSPEVRKEKLGDRITALHQIVSPFGKLLNGNGSKKRGRPDQEGNCEPKKDLRSRGLCLVPVSFFLDVGSDNGADYWVPTLHGAF